MKTRTKWSTKPKSRSLCQRISVIPDGPENRQLLRSHLSLVTDFAVHLYRSTFVHPIWCSTYWVTLLCFFTRTDLDCFYSRFPYEISILSWRGK